MCRLQQKSKNMDMTLKSGVKVKKIFLKSVTLFKIQTPLSCIDEVCLYLAQQLLII